MTIYAICGNKRGANLLTPLCREGNFPYEFRDSVRISPSHPRSARALTRVVSTRQRGVRQRVGVIAPRARVVGITKGANRAVNAGATKSLGVPRASTAAHHNLLCSGKTVRTAPVSASFNARTAGAFR